ncbi:hypothetical protein WICPIJ_002079 [Wickerhamomyces pijperi]|uniref:Secreted protein n=1 Tax=Wickerhamomyces pijperi TaxID=599730 RepID=A0A9P8Q9R0_WICPI|nr:hypothetical protein WICPIJ_002079 [Wickerhamomyces pijperi]
MFLKMLSEMLVFCEILNSLNCSRSANNTCKDSSVISGQLWTSTSIKDLHFSTSSRIDWSLMLAQSDTLTLFNMLQFLTMFKKAPLVI